MSAKKQKKEHSLIDEAYEKVPEIGQILTRWYDIPYNCLWWIIKHRKYTPSFLSSFAMNSVNNLLQFNELDRYKAWNKNDHMRSLHVPDDEHVAIPCIILVELFTPNEAKDLIKSLKRNGWDKKSRAYNETNSERLSQARSKDSLSWWRLATVVGKGLGGIPDKVEGNLPEGVMAIQLKAVQIGSGLTAVVARFTFEEQLRDHVDHVWHGEHRPYMEYIAGRPRPVDEKYAAYRNTQAARNKLHSEARNWMSSYCPGYFASHNEEQVSLDVILTEKYNPTSKSAKHPDHDLQDAYGALGIDMFDFHTIIAAELPDMLLTQAKDSSSRVINTNRTWSMIGNRSRIKKATGNFLGYGGDAYWGTGSIVDNKIGSTMILLAVSELLSILEAQYARLRDEAKHQHSKFKTRSLKKLADLVLDSSLTLASIKQDVANFQEGKWWFEGATFKITIAPFFRKRLKDRKTTIFFDDVLAQQKKTLERLVKIDSDYRAVLTSVSSLRSTTSNMKLSRNALWVTILSVLVAVFALVIAYMTYTVEVSNKTPTEESAKIEKK